jgi:hypothetical protein
MCKQCLCDVYACGDYTRVVVKYLYTPRFQRNLLSSRQKLVTRMDPQTQYLH